MTQRHPHSTAPGRSPSRTVAAPHAPLPAADQANASQADPPGLTFSVSVSALQHLIIEVLRRPVEFTQYTAIDDATRIRALRVYRRHTQQNAIAFADDVIRTCPLPYSHGAHRPRPCVPGPVALAPRGPGYPARRHQAPHPTPERDSRAVPSHGSAGVLSAPERQGRCRSGATAGRVGALLQLRSAPRSIRRADPVRSTSRTVTVMMATVPRDPSHHTAGRDRERCREAVGRGLDAVPWNPPDQWGEGAGGATC